MAIPPSLVRSLQISMGDAADELVTWMQRVDEHRSELRELNELSFSRIESRFNEERHWMEAQLSEARRTTDADFAELRQELTAGFASLREEMMKGDAALREEMTGRFDQTTGGLASVRTEIARAETRILRWSFMFWAAAVGTMVAFAR